MKILVTGGAGYIGSFMVKLLIDKGDEVIVLDNLTRGHKEALDKRASLIVGDLLDNKFVEEVFLNNRFDAVIHFAGYISMGESMKSPFAYFNNNIFSALNILDQMQKNNMNNFIFSSTAGVYGNPVKLPIPEDHPKNPTNPYGQSKLMVEEILSWYNKIYGLNFASLRYFNAAGASLDGQMGENHNPETHIIPNAINAAINKLEFNLYGDDYDTKDGTCIRDYIHVLDLVDSHVLALSKLQKDGGGFFYNVGVGNGYSNKEILEMVKKVSGLDINIKVAARRPGDAKTLISDPTKIKAELGFNPQNSNLEKIIETAWSWHSRNVK